MIGFQIKLNSLSKLDLTFSHGTAYVCLPADYLRKDIAQYMHHFPATVAILLFKRR